MKKPILILFCLSLTTHLFSDDSFRSQSKRQGKASGYSSRDATVLSMMGWGLGLAVGMGTFFALMDNNSSSSSGGGGGGDNGHSHSH